MSSSHTPAERDDLTVEGRSALIIPVSGLAEQVNSWRLRTDPTAREVPAHITVLVPFIPLGEFGPAEASWLTETLASIRAPRLVFDAVETFPSVVWLRPQSSEFFVELTSIIVRRWPEHPPYEGVFDDVVPHLTVAHGNQFLDAVREDLAPQLPMCGELSAVHLYAWTQGRWRDQARFDFASYQQR